MNPAKYVLYLTIFLNAIHFCTGQTQEIDSLKYLLKVAEDTSKVSLLRQLGETFRDIDKTKSVEFGVESLKKAREIDFIQGEINALYSLGITYEMTSDFSESLDYLHQCLSLAQKQRDFRRINKIYNVMGNVYSSIGDYPMGQSYYQKSIRLIDSMNLDMDTSAPYINMGVLYNIMGDQDKAIESYNKALMEYKGNNDDRKLLEIAVLSNLANIDFENGRYRSALEKWQKVSAYDEENRNFIELSLVYFHMGSCYVELEQWFMANDFYKKSLDLAKQLSAQEQIAATYYGLSDLMLRQGQFSEALEYAMKSLENLNIMGAYEQKRRTHEKVFQIYEATHEYPKAIDHLKLSMAYRDSLLNETKIKEIQNLEVRHNVYIKDKELKENELQLTLLNTQISSSKRRSIYLTIITILLLFSAGLLFLGYRNKMKSNTILHKKNKLISRQKEVIEDMNVILEKRMLRAQMNPHFIFNSLNSIQYLINTDDKANALKYLSKFSKLLRQVLESSINVSLVLKDEIELLKIYVELEGLRFDNSFHYTFDVDKNLDIDFHEVPMLLVQPYIENAIIHGLMPKKGEKHLRISFNDKVDYIECIIEDNGVGFSRKSKNTSLPKQSRGMSITAKRIDALKQFSDQELVKLENLKEGTRVTILVPKNH
ncbi:tetratricopeptide repeat protein [Flagellimonas lutimaris]|uniref:tetratricopeptide repeat protein n=1 Tax=Flagellimonas lutimaris TaxID=475082 RepID=UPI003F5CC759